MTVQKVIIIAIVVWNIVTFLMMGIDKFLAKHEKRRISEATLLGSAFVFGAIGSSIGALVFHHKTKKAKFIVLLPLCIIINVVAFIGLYTIFAK